MSDVIKYAHSSITGFQNGRVVTCVQKNGDYKVMPSGTMVINSYVPSGTRLQSYAFGHDGNQ